MTTNKVDDVKKSATIKNRYGRVEVLQVGDIVFTQQYQGEWQITDINEYPRMSSLQTRTHSAILRPLNGKAFVAMGVRDMMAATVQTDLCDCALVVTTHMIQSAVMSEKSRARGRRLHGRARKTTATGGGDES